MLNGPKTGYYRYKWDQTAPPPKNGQVHLLPRMRGFSPKLRRFGFLLLLVLTQFTLGVRVWTEIPATAGVWPAVRLGAGASLCVYLLILHLPHTTSKSHRF